MQSETEGRPLLPYGVFHEEELMGTASEFFQPTFSQGLLERNRAVLEQLPQVHFIAQRIHSRLPQHIPLEDLVSTGILGLMEALGKFDRRRKVELKSYASHRIRGAILDSLREQDWGPRSLRQKGRKMEEAHRRLTGELGRAPSRQELARKMSLSEERLNALLRDLHGLSISSLQSESQPEGKDLSESFPAREGESPFDLCHQAEMCRILGQAINALPSRQRRIMQQYYFDDMTMKEIGLKLGVCESRISQMHTSALNTLRSRLKSLSNIKAQIT